MQKLFKLLQDRRFKYKIIVIVTLGLVSNITVFIQIAEPQHTIYISLHLSQRMVVIQHSITDYIFKDRIDILHRQIQCRSQRTNAIKISGVGFIVVLIQKLIIYTQLLINQILLRILAICVICRIFTKYENIMKLRIIGWGLNV